jgi:hypothetical protein
MNFLRLGAGTFECSDMLASREAGDGGRFRRPVVPESRGTPLGREGLVKGACYARLGRLILGRHLLQAIDHQQVDRTFPLLQLQAELLL